MRGGERAGLRLALVAAVVRRGRHDRGVARAEREHPRAADGLVGRVDDGVRVGRRRPRTRRREHVLRRLRRSQHELHPVRPGRQLIEHIEAQRVRRRRDRIPVTIEHRVTCRIEQIHRHTGQNGLARILHAVAIRVDPHVVADRVGLEGVLDLERQSARGAVRGRHGDRHGRRDRDVVVSPVRLGDRGDPGERRQVDLVVAADREVEDDVVERGAAEVLERDRDLERGTGRGRSAAVGEELGEVDRHRGHVAGVDRVIVGAGPGDRHGRAAGVGVGVRIVLRLRVIVVLLREDEVVPRERSEGGVIGDAGPHERHVGRRVVGLAEDHHEVGGGVLEPRGRPHRRVEVVLAVRVGRRRRQRGTGRVAARVGTVQGRDGALDAGLVGVLATVAVGVVPDAVADLRGCRQLRDREPAQAAALLEAGGRLVSTGVGGVLIAAHHGTIGDIEPVDARDPDGAQRVEHGRGDLGQTGIGDDGAEGDVSVQVALRNGRVPRALVLVVVVELARVGAGRPLRVGGVGVRRAAVTHHAVVLERVGAGGGTRLVEVGARDQQITAGDRLVVGGLHSRLGRVVAVARLHGRTVGEAEGEVALGIEGQARQDRLRVDLQPAAAEGDRVRLRARGRGGAVSGVRRSGVAAPRPGVGPGVPPLDLQVGRGAVGRATPVADRVALVVAEIGREHIRPSGAAGQHALERRADDIGVQAGVGGALARGRPGVDVADVDVTAVDRQRPRLLGRRKPQRGAQRDPVGLRRSGAARGGVDRVQLAVEQVREQQLLAAGHGGEATDADTAGLRERIDVDAGRITVGRQTAPLVGLRGAQVECAAAADRKVLHVRPRRHRRAGDRGTRRGQHVVDAIDPTEAERAEAGEPLVGRRRVEVVAGAVVGEAPDGANLTVRGQSRAIREGGAGALGRPPRRADDRGLSAVAAAGKCRPLDGGEQRCVGLAEVFGRLDQEVDVLGTRGHELHGRAVVRPRPGGEEPLGDAGELDPQRRAVGDRGRVERVLALVVGLGGRHQFAGGRVGAHHDAGHTDVGGGRRVEVTGIPHAVAVEVAGDRADHDARGSAGRWCEGHGAGQCQYGRRQRSHASS